MGQSGKLDRRIQFRRYALSDDGFTQVEAWANHGSPVSASKKDISDQERWRAGEIAAHISCRFVVRSSAFARDITPKDRLVHDGTEYDISGIKEIGRRDRLEITAAARIDQ